MAGQKGQQIGQPGSVGAPGALGSAGIPRRYDIVNEYAWTTVPKNSELRAEAPNAYVTGYRLQFSQLQQFTEGYIGLVRQQTANNKKNPIQEGLDFYKNLYKPGTNNTKINFNFPYFDNNIRNFANNFDDTFSKVSSRGAQFGGPLADVFGGLEGSIIGGAAAVSQFGSTMLNTQLGDTSKGSFGGIGKAIGRVADALTNTNNVQGTYIETPKFYQYENTDAPLRVQFILANTIDEGDAERNLQFIRQFTKINRPTRLGPIAMTFPYIYHVEVPCQRYIEWAFLQDFSVELLGTKRKVRNQSGGCTIVPEAYGCSFAFKSLTVEAANFMEDDLLCDNNCAFEEYTAKQDKSDTKIIERAEKWKREDDEIVQGYWTRERNKTQIPGENKGGSPGNTGSGEYVPKVNEYVPKVNDKSIPKVNEYVPPDNQKQEEQSKDPFKIVPNVFEDSVSIETEPDFSGRITSPRKGRFDATKEGGNWANPNKPVDETNRPGTNYNKDGWETIDIQSHKAREPRQPYKGGGLNSNAPKRDPGLILPGDPRWKGGGDNLSKEDKEAIERLQGGG